VKNCAYRITDSALCLKSVYVGNVQSALPQLILSLLFLNTFTYVYAGKPIQSHTHLRPAYITPVVYRNFAPFSLIHQIFQGFSYYYYHLPIFPLVANVMTRLTTVIHVRVYGL